MGIDWPMDKYGYKTFGNCTWTCNTSVANSTATTTGPSTTNAYITYGDKYSISAKDFKTKLISGMGEVELPDGAKLIIDDLGNYRIEDKDAKVSYKANRIREFSPHLNASDMVAKFVEYVGTLGVKRAEVMGLPLHLFISWLIIEAAERDGDQVPGDVVPVSRDPLLKTVLRPKCLACGRFIRRLHYQNKFPFCAPEHAARFVASKPQLMIAN